MNSVGFIANVENSWVALIAIILFVFFIFLLIVWLFLDSGGAATAVLIIAIIFLIIAIVLFVYFFFFSTTVIVSPTGPSGPSGPSGNTGPSDSFIRFGDVVSLKNILMNQFASACGSIGDTCGGVQGALRSDSSFNQNGGNSKGLRSWRVTGGTSGVIVTYNSNITLISLEAADVCPLCFQNPMGVCSGDPPLVQIGTSLFAGSTSWIVIKGDGNTSTSTGVRYSDVINLRNSTFLDTSGENTYLITCTTNSCVDLSGPGCGPILLVDSHNENPEAQWTMMKI